ncbi:MerR family transcriptional regulator [Micromonospora sp. C95]|uniref:MerR family transcriptional regulator n=1 Tax=Micromonospora sp. C95 TaxID=2824882 RepID=UPI001B35D843|nr:MerR family transcriptional regulator [Micromonospora sp. C95]MBQ1026816.1 MerR family transcriptional regulator [Micromonospora sp. C95]
MSGPGLRSGQLANAAGINLQTLRYYERRGLLASPQRSPGGHRLYPSDTVTLLRVIKTAQRLGFTLNEVADLLAAGRHQHSGQPDGGLQARAREKLVEVEQKLSDLTVIRDTLRAAISAGCDDLVACAGSSCCPLPFAELAGRNDRADTG